MSDIDPRESGARQLIGQEAIEWFARMNDPDVSLEDRRLFVAWLKQSGIHIAEYLRVAELDAGLRDAKLIRLTGEEDSNVVALRPRRAPAAQEAAREATQEAAQEAAQEATQGAAAQLPPVLVRPWNVAAAVVLFAIFSIAVFVASNVWKNPGIETQLGEWKTATLADGSTVRLGPNTLLRVAFSDAQRSLCLVRGEAYFSVAKDPRRPFVVQADDFAVRAVGTQFAVSRRKHELIVTVTEGKVRVARSGQPATERTVVGKLQLNVPIVADQQLRIGAHWPVTPKWVDVQYALAWKDRRLRFQEGDTLEDAIEEFNLRNRLQLRLAPDAPRTLPVRGNFDAADPQSFAATIDRNPTIRVVAIAPGVLRMMAE